MPPTQTLQQPTLRPSLSQILGTSPKPTNSVPVPTNGRPPLSQILNTPKPADTRPPLQDILSGKVTAPQTNQALPNDTGNKIANDYASYGQDVTKNASRLFGDTGDTVNHGSFLDNFTSSLKDRLFAAGHIAGDVAGAAFSPLARGAEALPKAIKGTLPEAANKVGDVVNKIPGATDLLNHVNSTWDSFSPDTKQALSKDLPNLVMLLGSSEASPINPDIPNIKGVINTVAGDVKGAVSATQDALTPASVKNATKASDYVDRITQTHKNFMADDVYDPKTMGDLAQNIKNIQDDIKLNFEKGSFQNPELGAKIAQLDPAKFNSIDEFNQAAKNIIKDSSQGQSLTGKLQDKYVNDLANKYRQVMGSTKSTNKVMNRSVAAGKDPAQYLAERNIVPEVEGGKMRTTTQADALHKSVDPLNEHLDMALDEVQAGIPKTNIEDVRRSALANIERLPNVTETARAQIKSAVNKEFDLQKEKLGETATLKQINSIKKAAWADTKFDSTNPYKGDASYNIGKAAMNTIERTVPKDALPVHELNQEIGKAYDAEKTLRSLEGGTVKGGRLGRYFGRVTGAVIGKALPIPGGEIVGALGGDAVAQMLQKTTFSNPLKEMILRNLEVKDPAAYQQALKFLKDSSVAREARPKLPAPSPLGSSKNPIIPPAPKAETTYEAPAAVINRIKSSPGKTIFDMMNKAQQKDLVDKFLNEPYSPTEKLPVIKGGGPIRPKPSDLPTIK